MALLFLNVFGECKLVTWWYVVLFCGSSDSEHLITQEELLAFFVFYISLYFPRARLKKNEYIRMNTLLWNPKTPAQPNSSPGKTLHGLTPVSRYPNGIWSAWLVRPCGAQHTSRCWTFGQKSPLVSSSDPFYLSTCVLSFFVSLLWISKSNSPFHCQDWRRYCCYGLGHLHSCVPIQGETLMEHALGFHPGSVF